jgi:hypothetical protein
LARCERDIALCFRKAAMLRGEAEQIERAFRGDLVSLCAVPRE